MMKSFAVAILCGLASAQWNQYTQFRQPAPAPAAAPAPKPVVAAAAPVANDTEDLEEDITDLKSEIATLTTSLGSVETKCDDQGVQIATLSGAVTTLNGWVEPLFDQTVAYSTEIAGIQALIPTLTSRVSSIESNLQDEKVRVAVLQTQIGSVTDLETRIAALETQVTTDLSDLESRVGTLEGQIGTITSDINSNSQLISGLDGRITGLETTAQNLQISVDQFDAQKVLEDFFSVNSASLTITPADTTIPADNAEEELLNFCAGEGQYVEIYLTANIQAASATAFVKEIRLEVDGQTVASDAKSMPPSSAGEDRSFALFYKQIVPSAVAPATSGNFVIKAIFDYGRGESITADAGSVAFGYRTYNTGYPVAAVAAACP